MTSAYLGKEKALSSEMEMISREVTSKTTL